MQLAKVTIIGLIGVVFSLILQIVCLYQNNTSNWVQLLLQNLSATLLIASSVGIVINYISQKSIKHQIKNLQESLKVQINDLLDTHMPSILVMNDIGIQRVSHQVNTEIYSDIITNSNELVLCMNDGRRFISNNIEYLKKRLKMEEKTTTVLLPNPDSDYIKILTKKTGHEGDYVQNKIKESIKELFKFQRPESHNLEIYIHDLFNTTSVILSENKAIVALYRISAGKDHVPHLIITKGDENSEYGRVKKDMESLKESSTKYCIPQ